jgi:hypothetical protein
MVTGAEIMAAFQGLKTGLGMLQALNATAKAAAINEVKVQLTQHILDAQQALTAAGMAQSDDAQRIANLEQQIADMGDWETEKQRYQLKAIDTGAFAYMHKTGMECGEPAMWLCQTCFEKRHRSPLQFRGQDAGSGGPGRGTHSRWGCNHCKSEVVVHYRRNPAKVWETPPEEVPEPPAPPPAPPKIDRGESSWVTARRGGR